MFKSRIKLNKHQAILVSEMANHYAAILHIKSTEYPYGKTSIGLILYHSTEIGRIKRELGIGRDDRP